MLVVIALGLLLGATVWAYGLWSAENRSTGAFLITPFLLFVFSFAAQVIYAALLHTEWRRLNEEPFPLLVAAAALLAFLAGYTWFRRPPGLLERFVALRPVLGIGENQTAYFRAAVVLTVILVAVGLATYTGLPPIIESWRAILRGDFDQATALSAAERFRLTKSPWFGGSDSGSQNIAQPPTSSVGLFSCLWRSSGSAPIRPGARGGSAGIESPVWRVPSACCSSRGTSPGSPRWRPSAWWGSESLSCSRLAFGPSRRSSPSAWPSSLFLPRLLPREPGSACRSSSTACRTGFPGNGQADFDTIRLLREGVLEHRNGTEHINRTLSGLPGVRIGTPFAYQLAQIQGNDPSNTSFRSTTYLGIVYLDFGLPGVVVIFLIVGMAVALSYRWLYLQPKTPRHVAAVALVSWIIGNWVVTGPIFSLPDLVVLAILWVVFELALRLASPSRPIGPRRRVVPQRARAFRPRR